MGADAQATILDSLSSKTGQRSLLRRFPIQYSKAGTFFGSTAFVGFTAGKLGVSARDHQNLSGKFTS